MSRRRGSATALNASDVVAARAMRGIIFLYWNMSSSESLNCCVMLLVAYDIPSRSY